MRGLAARSLRDVDANVNQPLKHFHGHRVRDRDLLPDSPKEATPLAGRVRRNIRKRVTQKRDRVRAQAQISVLNSPDIL